MICCKFHYQQIGHSAVRTFCSVLRRWVSTSKVEYGRDTQVINFLLLNVGLTQKRQFISFDVFDARSKLAAAIRRPSSSFPLKHLMIH